MKNRLTRGPYFHFLINYDNIMNKSLLFLYNYRQRRTSQDSIEKLNTAMKSKIILKPSALNQETTCCVLRGQGIKGRGESKSGVALY